MRLSFSGFPNPAISDFQFGYSVPNVVSYRYVLVDGSYRVLTQGDSPFPGNNLSFTVNASSPSLQQGKRYRMYYVLYNGTALYAKGHGDFKCGKP